MLATVVSRLWLHQVQWILTWCFSMVLSSVTFQFPYKTRHHVNDVTYFVVRGLFALLYYVQQHFFDLMSDEKFLIRWVWWWTIRNIQRTPSNDWMPTGAILSDFRNVPLLFCFTIPVNHWKIILTKKSEGVYANYPSQKSPHAAPSKSLQKSGAFPANVQGNLGLSNG